MVSRHRVIGSVLAIALAACGGSAGTSQVPGSTASPAPSGTAATQPTDAPPAGEAAQACTLLTDTEVAEAAGFPLIGKEPGRTQGIFPNGCVWELDSGIVGAPWEVVLGVIGPGGREYYDRHFADFEGEPLAGLGDAALRMAANSVVAVEGDVLVSLQYIQMTGPTRDEVPPALIRFVFARVAP